MVVPQAFQALGWKCRSDSCAHLWMHNIWQNCPLRAVDEWRRLLAYSLTSDVWKISRRVFRVGNYAPSTLGLKNCYKRASIKQRVLAAYFHTTFPTWNVLYTCDWLDYSYLGQILCSHTPFAGMFLLLPVVCKVSIKARKAFGRCCCYEQVGVCLF